MRLPKHLAELRVRYEQDENMRLSESQLEAIYGDQWRMHERRDIDEAHTLETVGNVGGFTVRIVNNSKNYGF